MKRLLPCLLFVPLSVLAHGNDRHDRHHGDNDFRIEVLSGRPDMVAGGDALVRISVEKKHVRLSDVRVELNGQNITGAFVADHGANRTLQSGRDACSRSRYFINARRARTLYGLSASRLSRKL